MKAMKATKAMKAMKARKAMKKKVVSKIARRRAGEVLGLFGEEGDDSRWAAQERPDEEQAREGCVPQVVRARQAGVGRRKAQSLGRRVQEGPQGPGREGGAPGRGVRRPGNWRTLACRPAAPRVAAQY